MRAGAFSQLLLLCYLPHLCCNNLGYHPLVGELGTFMLLMAAKQKCFNSVANFIVQISVMGVETSLSTLIMYVK